MNRTDKRVRLLRTAYWYGIVVDGLSLIPMLSPGAGAAIFGIDGFSPGPDYRYAIYLGSALMAGWTLLLWWADRRPVERRGVLLLTAVPVCPGLLAAAVYAGASGLVDFAHLVPMLVLPLFAIALFLVAYRYATPASSTTHRSRSRTA